MNKNKSKLKKETTIELSEKDVILAIELYVKHYHDMEVKNISFSTGVRGSYDSGNAKEYVKKVYCTCKEIE